MDDNNFDFITKFLTGEVEINDIYDTYDKIVAKLSNITTLD